MISHRNKFLLFFGIGDLEYFGAMPGWSLSREIEIPLWFLFSWALLTLFSLALCRRSARCACCYHSVFWLAATNAATQWHAVTRQWKREPEIYWGGNICWSSDVVWYNHVFSIWVGRRKWCWYWRPSQIEERRRMAVARFMIVAREARLLSSCSRMSKWSEEARELQYGIWSRNRISCVSRCHSWILDFGRLIVFHSKK